MFWARSAPVRVLSGSGRQCGHERVPEYLERGAIWSRAVMIPPSLIMHLPLSQRLTCLPGSRYILNAEQRILTALCYWAQVVPNGNKRSGKARLERAARQLVELLNVNMASLSWKEALNQVKERTMEIERRLGRERAARQESERVMGELEQAQHDLALEQRRVQLLIRRLKRRKEQQAKLEAIRVLTESIKQLNALVMELEQLREEQRAKEIGNETNPPAEVKPISLNRDAVGNGKRSQNGTS